MSCQRRRHSGRPLTCQPHRHFDHWLGGPLLQQVGRLVQQLGGMRPDSPNLRRVVAQPADYGSHLKGRAHARPRRRRMRETSSHKKVPCHYAAGLSSPGNPAVGLAGGPHDPELHTGGHGHLLGRCPGTRISALLSCGGLRGGGAISFHVFSSPSVPSQAACPLCGFAKSDLAAIQSALGPWSSPLLLLA